MSDLKRREDDSLARSGLVAAKDRSGVAVACLERLLCAAPGMLDAALVAVLADLAAAIGAERGVLWGRPGDAPLIGAPTPLHTAIADPGELAPGALIVALESGSDAPVLAFEPSHRKPAFTDADRALVTLLGPGVAGALRRRAEDRRAETFRRQSQETLVRLRATLAAMPELVLEIDAEGRCIDYHCNNPQLLAQPPDALIGRTLEETLPADVAALQRGAMAEARRNGTARLAPYALGEGEARRWYRLTVASLDPGSGQNGGGFVFRIRDVTDDHTREAENALLTEITRHMTNMVLVLDEDRRIQWANPAFEARTGYALSEVRGQIPAAFFSPMSAPEELARIDAALQTRTPARAEIFKRDRHGVPYWVEIEIQPLTDHDGQPRGFLVIKNDISQRKEHERELARLAQEAETAHRRLQDAVEALPDGFALFDPDDRLALCNARFQSLFPGMEETVVPGVPYEDLVRRTVAAGQIPAARGREEAWIAERLAQHAQPSSVTEIGLLDGRWIRVYERATPDGGRVGLRVDITALKETERRLNALIEGARVGTWEFDLARGETRINARWSRMLGRAGRSVRRMDRAMWDRLLHPEDATALRAALRAVRDGLTDTFEHEVRLRHRDGHWLHVLTRGHVTERDARGKALRISGLGFDITERRRAEERLHTILDAAAVGTWELHSPTGETIIDDNYAAMLGYSLEALQPFDHARFESLVHPHDLRLMHESVAQLSAARKERFAHEFRMRHRDGHWVWILSRARVERWGEDGRALVENGIHIDITERKQREAALAEARSALEGALTAHRASEQRFSDIAAVSRDWFWEIDADLCLQVVTSGFSRTTGIAPGDVLNRPLLQSMRGYAEPEAAEVLDRLANRFRVRMGFDEFLLPVRPPGSPRRLWLRLSGTPFYNATGQFAGYRGVGTDVSALIAATERAEAANRAKSWFLANMSHELRTPLTGVLGMAELLSETARDPQQKEMIETIRDSGEGLLAILNDVLDLAKIEAGKFEIEQEALVPESLISKVKALFAPRARAAGLALNVRISPDCSQPIRGDSKRVLQVLNNLVGNAIKFTEKGGVGIHARLIGHNAARMLELVVDDTGIGMTKEQVNRVFEEFEQAEGSTARRFGGTGLGLSITRRLIDLMGGQIAMTSAPGIGTTVTVTLPAPPVEVSAQHAQGGAEPARAELRGRRVLVADDNRTNRRILETMLTSLGLEVTLAEDGTQACARFVPDRFDLVMLDISMPVMDGLQALARIRELEAKAGSRPIPILAVTANAMQHQVEEYLQAGFCGHIPKPFRKSGLESAISDALSAVEAGNSLSTARASH